MFKISDLVEISRNLIRSAHSALPEKTGFLGVTVSIQHVVLLALMSPVLSHAALPFAVAPVQFKEVDQTYAAEALVEAVKQATVSSQISGRIVEINFDAGDFVKKGQVLVRIDEREASQALAGSQAQVAQAQASLQNAKANYDRTKQLVAQKFVSQAALDKALSEYKAAQAQAQASLAGAGVAATTKGFATIVAPYSGVVAARHAELGEMASPGKPLMTGFDPKDLRVVASIPQYKLPEVRQSPRATVEFPALNKWVKVTTISVLPAAEARTHTTRVRLDLPENTKDVIPGMYARAHFTVGRTRKLLVPDSAVIRRSEVTAVYVVDKKEQIHLRYVRLGESAGQAEIEVLAGLMPGEIIATEPVKAGIYLKQLKK
ncbi:efflux RND transporter periplasmic adaptor subunit [Sulfurirhabdus autotrophica]|uniref:RND family efflux transporter MFP subunit n=1 Tax=Sulfurirhabdus autotrophica TaxID=1706046 RepID=A0A4V2W1R8_9PROT|nr:efflux RND transporter periplasmic adaptor subunit [Sulfurirhabdus autotrophica]TCV85199.1 RND family efflux transporter MFP subunit [Sulfurirhabdus autotrophica]